MEEYDSDLYLFETNGYKIRVKNALIGEALSKLPKKNRILFFCHFFLDMSEADIAKQLNLGQSTIHYHKANSLKELKKIMEEKCSAKYKQEKKE